ncbi:hypothetical protein EUGRSUZ_B03300 [Eucalyptus grandis]|uniref:Uncharacterized protein n=2 Tax=Eucalyptus grandis TaxID=71139 RepID=A0ACC3LWG0_EUCGR|nr:hypothetical protein EUGRSUZ_B03300 [Eucalyptus grandis]
MISFLTCFVFLFDFLDLSLRGDIKWCNDYHFFLLDQLVLSSETSFSVLHVVHQLIVGRLCLSRHSDNPSLVSVACCNATKQAVENPQSFPQTNGFIT